MATASIMAQQATTSAIAKPSTFTFKVFKQQEGPLGPKQPIHLAKIHLQTVHTHMTYRTNAKGKKIIKHLPNAKYTITISKPGCKTHRQKLKKTFATSHLTVGLKCN